VGGVADGDLVECPVLDEIVCFDGHGEPSGFAMQQSNSTENRVTNFSVRSKTLLHRITRRARLAPNREF
jgi:hypothetical protein